MYSCTTRGQLHDTCIPVTWYHVQEGLCLGRRTPACGSAHARNGRGCNLCVLLSRPHLLMVLTWNYRVPRRVWTKTEIKSTFWGLSTKVLGTNCLGAEREHRCSTQFSSATCRWFIPQSWSRQKFPGRDTRLHLPWWWLSCPTITPSYGNSQG